MKIFRSTKKHQQRYETDQNIGINQERNWAALAAHLQAKVLQRTSEVSFLHTKAGFLIAAAAVNLQIIADLPKHPGDTISPYVTLLTVAAILLSIASLVLSVASMNISRGASPLNPDEMILGLAERPQMTHVDFMKWLAKSYAKTNENFNIIYNKKYKLQVYSSILLIISFTIIFSLKGVHSHA